MVSYRNLNPRLCASAGSTRCPLRIIASAISPRASRSANAGAGRIDGRRSARPIASAISRLVTGCGAVMFTGPLTLLFASAHRTIAIQSSR